jgi:hypothetical protein
VLAHHDIIVLFQGTAVIGLTGWAAVIGARRYSVTQRRTAFRRLTSTTHLEKDHAS